MFVYMYRLLCFDEATCLFHQIAKLATNRCCLLQVQHFIASSCTEPGVQNTSSAVRGQSSECAGSGSQSVYILTGATDGRIELWDITDAVLTFCRTFARKRQIENKEVNDEPLVDKEVTLSELIETDSLASDSCSSDDDDDDDEDCLEKCNSSEATSAAACQGTSLCVVQAHAAGVNSMALHSLQGNLHIKARKWLLLLIKATPLLF